jgi:hypothetical protein
MVLTESADTFPVAGAFRSVLFRARHFFSAR